MNKLFLAIASMATTHFLQKVYRKITEKPTIDREEIYRQMIKDEINRKDGVGKRWFEQCMEARAENVRLKRALWLDRAERAHVTTLYWNVYCYQNNCLYFRDFMPENCNPFRSLHKKTALEWSDLWESIETKCREYAEKYK